MIESSGLSGSTVALITPFRADGEIDESALRRLIDWQIEEGSDVLLVAGTTGESATLTSEEHTRILSIALEQVGGRIPVLCGTGSNSTARTVAATKQAEALGADGVLVVCPYYNKPTQAGLREHFRTVAESTSLPLILYNVPGRTASNLAAETTLALAEIDNVVGIKEASGNYSQIMAIIQGKPKGFLVLSGDDADGLALIALGADGVISVVANETPGLFAEMVRAARSGDLVRARELHYRLLPLMEVNFIESNPGPVKAALAMMGKIEEMCRLPLVPIGPTNRQKVRQVLQQLELIP